MRWSGAPRARKPHLLRTVPSRHYRCRSGVALRIVGMRCLYLAVPVDSPVRTSFGEMRERPVVLVLLESDDGLIGLGESWCNYPAWGPIERLATLKHGIKPLLVGMEFENVPEVTSGLLHRLEPLGRQWGARGPIYQAISAIDTALWDLKGQASGLSISHLLSSQPASQVPVYASGLGPDKPVPLAADLYASGVTTLKLKVGFGFDRDQSNLESLRAEYSGARLAVDANQAWDYGAATEFGRLLEEFQCLWVEEPVPCNELDVLRRLQRQLPCPVAGGENYYGWPEFHDVLESKAVGVIQPDVSKAGGISQAMAVMRAANTYGLQYAPHYLGGAVGFAATLHCFAAVAGGVAVEMDANPNPLLTQLSETPFIVSEGTVSVPKGPGLGIALNQDIVKQYLRVEE